MQRSSDSVAGIEVTKTELVWPGKYNEDGTRREVERPNPPLPFQIIKIIHESRGTWAGAKESRPTLARICGSGVYPGFGWPIVRRVFGKEPS